MRNLFKEYINEISVNNRRDLFDQHYQQQKQATPLNRMYLNEFAIKNIENRVFDQFQIENLQEKIQKKLFLEALDRDENEKSTIYFEFNTDTKLKALGGLSIWQFTAICIFVLILLAILFCLVKKIIFLYSQRKQRLVRTINQRAQYATSKNSYFSESSDKLLTEAKCDPSLNI